jgi:hypothetical protein
VPLEDHAWLKPGVRVYNASQQYPEARVHGTATVRAVMIAPNSSYKQVYDADDIEVVIEPDREGDKPYSWQDYRTYKAQEQGDVK